MMATLYAIALMCAWSLLCTYLGTLGWLDWGWAR